MPPTASLGLIIACLAAAPAPAQDKAAEAPPDMVGQQIAARAKAKGRKLHDARVTKAYINGKKFELVPADLIGFKSRDLKDGLFIGVLETEATITEDVWLLPGSYDLYVARINGEWRAYAENNGRLVKARRAVERPDTPPNMSPVGLGGGCWWLWLITTGVDICW